MHQLTLPFGFCAWADETVLAFWPTPDTVLPPPPLLLLPQPAAMAAHARIAPPLASFLFTMFLLTEGVTELPPPRFPSVLPIPYPTTGGPNPGALLRQGCPTISGSFRRDGALFRDPEAARQRARPARRRTRPRRLGRRLA